MDSTLPISKIIQVYGTAQDRWYYVHPRIGVKSDHRFSVYEPGHLFATPKRVFPLSCTFFGALCSNGAAELSVNNPEMREGKKNRPVFCAFITTCTRCRSIIRRFIFAGAISLINPPKNCCVTMKKIANQLERCLQEKGMALLVNHGIPQYKVKYTNICICLPTFAIPSLRKDRVMHVFRRCCDRAKVIGWKSDGRL